MSIAPDMSPKRCFIPCPDWKVKSGQCSCCNLSIDTYWTQRDIDELKNQIKAQRRDNDIIKDDKDKNGSNFI